MKKSERQKLIIDIIKSNEIETQEELISLLYKNGCEVTQATASRDIKELDLVKVSGTEKRYKYAQVSYGDTTSVHTKFGNIFKESVVSLQCAQNIVVIKTVIGSASSAAAFIDNLALPEVVGCIAGDDTIFIVTLDDNGANALVKHLKSLF